MPQFELIDDEKLLDTMSSYVENNTENRRRGGYSDVLKMLVLKLLPDSQKIVEKAILSETRLSILMQFVEMEGFLAEQHTKLTSYKKLGDLIRSTGTQQCLFLAVQLFFLIELYAKISQSKLGHLPLSSADILLKAILQEIRIAVNAYRIKTAYSKCTAIQDITVAETDLTTFVSSFLQQFGQKLLQMEAGDELCFPTGFDGHAIYLNFLCLGETVLLRVDNLGEGKDYHSPHTKTNQGYALIPFFSVTELNVDQIATTPVLIDYLKNVCWAKTLKLNDKITRNNKEATPLTLIYNSNVILTLPAPVSQTHRFPSRPEQLNDNCVVENYKVGMCYRFLSLGGTPELMVYKWLIEENIKSLAVGTIPTDARNAFDLVMEQRHKAKSSTSSYNEVKQKLRKNKENTQEEQGKNDKKSQKRLPEIKKENTKSKFSRNNNNNENYINTKNESVETFSLRPNDLN